MNRRLNPGKAAMMWRLSFLLLAMAIIALLFSCASRKPEAGESGAEASSTREDSLPALPDDTESKAGEEPGGDAAATIPESEDVLPEAPELAAEEPEGDAALAISESEDSLPEAPEPAAEEPGADAAAGIPESEDSLPEAPGPAAEEPEGEAAVAIPETAAPAVERDEPGPEAAEGSIQPSVSDALATFPDKQSEEAEINPLLLADRAEDNLRGAEEIPDAASEADESGIDPPAVEAGSEQPGQAGEASSDSAISAATPTRILEAPGELTITLESIGWIFRSDRSTPGTWRFLGREIIGDSSSFRFLFSEIGEWNFVFERQDLSSGESEEAIRRVTVDEVDGSPSIEDGSIPLASSSSVPGTLPADADARYAAALAAREAGKTDEAIKYYEQDASRDDSVGVRARDGLIETAAESGVVGPLLTWLPRYLEDSPDPGVLQEALEVFSSGAGYDAQSRAILEELVKTEDPEWLYRLAALLEKPGEERNLDRAARLYQEVITRWPLTRWRDSSEERLLWLKRHYFRVR